MTLPNKLTMIRILLIPVLIVIYYIPYFRDNNIFLNVSISYFVMCMIFIVASITDFFDGKIARKRNLVTTFGKLADPLADKCLVMAALAILVKDGLVPVWVLVVILMREFLVSGIRMIMIEHGTVVAAAKMGKWKTFTTMVAIIVLFFSGLHEGVYITGEVLIYIACLLTIISGIEYFWNARKVIFESF